MAERRPLVILDGNIQELPTGDTLPGSGSGGGSSVTLPTFAYWRWTFGLNSNWSSGFTLGYISVDDPLVGNISGGISSYGTVEDAFDGSSATFWGTTTANINAGESYIIFEFTTPTWLNTYSITSRSGSGSQGPSDWILEASHDGVTWTLIDTQSDVASWGNSITRTYTSDIQQPTEAEVLSGIPAQAGLFLQTKTDGSTEWADPLPAIEAGDASYGIRVKSDESGFEIDRPNPGNTFTEWRLQLTEAGSYAGGALGEIEMYDIEGTELTEGGTASAYSDTYGDPENVFNGSSLDWAGATSPSMASGGVWIGYTFPTPVWVDNYAVTARSASNGAQTSRGWNLQYKDGDEWVTAVNVTGEASFTNSERRTYTNTATMPATRDFSIPEFTPSNAGKLLRVKADSSGFEYTHESSYQMSDVSSGFTLNDTFTSGNVLVKSNSATNVTITVDTGLTNLDPCTFVQVGAGQLIFLPGTGVTILSADGKLKTRTQYSSATLVPDKEVPNTFYLIGDLDT